MSAVIAENLKVQIEVLPDNGLQGKHISTTSAENKQHNVCGLDREHHVATMCMLSCQSIEIYPILLEKNASGTPSGRESVDH